MTTRKREKLCSFPGCKVLTTSRHCELHTRSTSYHTSPDARASKQFLNSTAWLRLRSLKLSITPWCEECEREGVTISVPASQVDHVKPRATHPELKLMLTNLQSLCDACHGKKTRRGE
jgi:5-methylcytosine-specific restriction enzyme A